jgi:thioredoxin-related protein
MKRFLILSLLLVASTWTFGQTASPAPAKPATAVKQAPAKIEWLTWEEAAKRMEKEPRKIMVDVFTDWCGWCKRMDATTMLDPRVINQINNQYYAVKMDGEAKHDIIFKGRTYKFVAKGQRGYHELPAELMNGQMSYPTLVFLDEEYSIIQPLPGYQEAPMLEMILAYFGKDAYKNTPWEQFQASFKSSGAN